MVVSVLLITDRFSRRAATYAVSAADFTPEDAQDTCALVRKTVGDLYNKATAESVRIQYGGSVKPGTAPDLMSQPDIDGALIGGAALSAEDFAHCIQYRLR